MIKLHVGFSIGSHTTYDLTPIEYNMSKRVHIFERLLYHDLVYHSIQYPDGVGKQDSTICLFKRSNG